MERAALYSGGTKPRSSVSPKQNTNGNYNNNSNNYNATPYSNPQSPKSLDPANFLRVAPKDIQQEADTIFAKYSVVEIRGFEKNTRLLLRQNK